MAGACVVASVVAWNTPNFFASLLRPVAIVSLVAVVVVKALRWCMIDYLHMSYMKHDLLVVYVLLGTWFLMTGLPALWLKTRSLRTGRVWVIIMVLTNIGWWTQPMYPTDAVLRAHFLKHRAAFDQLGTMVQTDRSVQSAINLRQDGLSVLAHASPPQRNAYVRLLRSIGVDQNMWHFEKGRLTLTYRATGGVEEGFKCYTYMYNASVPAPLVPSLDTQNPTLQARYRSLAPPWYMCDFSGGLIMP